jgi:hypothetical protein
LKNKLGRLSNAEKMLGRFVLVGVETLTELEPWWLLVLSSSDVWVNIMGGGLKSPGLTSEGDIGDVADVSKVIMCIGLDVPEDVKVVLIVVEMV